MKFTLSVTLQIKLVLKCMVHQINASLQNAEMQEVKNVYPPLPFANNKFYGNKLSMHGTGKLRGTNE